MNYTLDRDTKRTISIELFQIIETIEIIMNRLYSLRDFEFRSIESFFLFLNKATKQRMYTLNGIEKQIRRRTFGKKGPESTCISLTTKQIDQTRRAGSKIKVTPGAAGAGGTLACAQSNLRISSG